MLGPRNAFTSHCPAPQGNFQPLGATVRLTGVGFWNPVKTTAGVNNAGGLFTAGTPRFEPTSGGPMLARM